MTRSTGDRVRVWKIRERPDKASPFRVRWSYLGKEHDRAFQLESEAELFKSRLITAINNYERFSVETGEPVSWALKDMTIAKVAKTFVDSIKLRWAPKTRSSNLPPIAEALVLLVPKRAPAPPADILTAICDWLMSDNGDCPAWLAKHSLSVPECTPPVCSEVMDQLTKKRTTTGTGASRLRSANTVNRYRRAISQLFSYATKRELFTSNPWPQVERGKKKTRSETNAVPIAQRSRPSAEQVVETIGKLKNHQPISKDYQVLAWIVWHTGMRPAEARALRIEMCVLPEQGLGQVFISEAVQGGPKRYFLDDEDRIGQTKTGNVRSMPLNPELVRIIREHIGERKSGLICRTRNGGLISETNFERAWARVRGESNKWRIYDLRHTHATLAVRAGASPDKVAQWLGHDKEVLMSIYFGELPDDEATARRIYETGPFTVEIDGNQPKTAPKRATSRTKKAQKPKRPAKKTKTR
jgi:integrase